MTDATSYLYFERIKKMPRAHTKWDALAVPHREVVAFTFWAIIIDEAHWWRVELHNDLHRNGQTFSVFEMFMPFGTFLFTLCCKNNAVGLIDFEMHDPDLVSLSSPQFLTPPLTAARL
jgi:hypothetical protein